MGSRIDLPDGSGVRGRVGAEQGAGRQAGNAARGSGTGTANAGGGTSPAALPDGWLVRGREPCFLRYGSDVRVQDKRGARTDPGSGTAA